MTCDPSQFMITFGNKIDDPSSKEYYRVTFISPTICSEKNTILCVSTPHSKNKCEFSFPFTLEDLWIGSISTPNDKDTQPLDSKINYKRFMYLASIEFEDSKISSFEYFVRIDNNVDNKYSRNPFKMSSKVYQYDQSEDKISFIALADHMYYEEKEKQYLSEKIKSQDYDLIIMMGDLAYELVDDNGLKADKYFTMMEPLFTKAPVIIVGGNHDLNDFGRFLNFRFRSPGTVSAEETVLFRVFVGPMSFLFFNFDLFYYNMPEVQNDYLIQLNSIKEEFKTRNTPFKIFVSHRPFYCINGMSNERCNLWAMITKSESLFSDMGINVVLSGHKHLYQRFQKQSMKSLWWYPMLQNSGKNITPKQSNTQKVKSKLDENILCLIVGAAGLIEHELYNSPQYSWLSYANINGEDQGFLRLVVSKTKVDGQYMLISKEVGHEMSVKDHFVYHSTGILDDVNPSTNNLKIHDKYQMYQSLFSNAKQNTDYFNNFKGEVAHEFYPHSNNLGFTYDSLNRPIQEDLGEDAHLQTTETQNSNEVNHQQQTEEKQLKISNKLFVQNP